MRVTKLTVNSHIGENKRPHSGFVSFDDGKGYYWSFEIAKNENEEYRATDKITLMGSKKLSIGHTNRTFYSAKRESAIKNYFENNY